MVIYDVDLKQKMKVSAATLSQIRQLCFTTCVKDMTKVLLRFVTFTFSALYIQSLANVG